MGTGRRGRGPVVAGLVGVLLVAGAAGPAGGGSTAAAPDTELLSGPPADGFTTSRTAELSWTSPDPVAGWECTLDHDPLPCEDGHIRLTRLAAGTHVFTVAAVDEAGDADPTPARRSWTVPRNDRVLERDDRWTRVRDRAAFGRTRLRATRRGATLTSQGIDVRAVALVATTSRRAGVVAVFRGRERLGRFDLSSRRLRHRRLVPVASFQGVRSGELRVVVRSRGRPVVVEGLGVATWFATPAT